MVSSPSVTKLMQAELAASRALKVAGSRPRKLAEATSVSRTMKLTQDLPAVRRKGRRGTRPAPRQIRTCQAAASHRLNEVGEPPAVAPTLPPLRAGRTATSQIGPQHCLTRMRSLHTQGSAKPTFLAVIDFVLPVDQERVSHGQCWWLRWAGRRRRSRAVVRHGRHRPYEGFASGQPYRIALMGELDGGRGQRRAARSAPGRRSGGPVDGPIAEIRQVVQGGLGEQVVREVRCIASTRSACLTTCLR